MEEIDYSIETEEEFFEDWGSNNLSDEDLTKILIKARRNSDAELRIIIKELQYARYLLTHIVDFVEEDTSEFLTIQKLVKIYVNAIIRANSKDS